jgi:hypothetical protein
MWIYSSTPPYAFMLVKHRANFNVIYNVETMTVGTDTAAEIGH